MSNKQDAVLPNQPVYTGSHLDRVAFPLGGIGAGMISLEGSGALSQVSLRHKPDVYHEPQAFAALHVKGAKTARVLEGPVPMWKAFGSVTPPGGAEPGNGLPGRTYGLPRFADASFQAHFPFATVKLTDKAMPVAVEITGWSPFTPGAADDSSLPVGAIEYRFVNRSAKPVKAVFSFHAANFMKTGHGACVGTTERGFVLEQPALPGQPEAEGAFTAFTDDPATMVDAAWFRGGHFDALTMVWNHVAAGAVVSRPPHPEGAPGAGGSLYVPFVLKPRAEKTVRLQFAWYVPRSALSVGGAAIPPGAASFLADGWRVSRLMPVGDVTAAPHLGLDTDAGWENVPAGGRCGPGFVNIHPLRGPAGMVYVARNIHVEVDGECVLHIGHDGPVRVFVDGEPVAATRGTVKPAPVVRTQVRLRLTRGTHELCVALDRDNGEGWGFFASLQNPSAECGSGCGCNGAAPLPSYYSPWYARRFAGLADVVGYWSEHYERLRAASAAFRDCFYDTTLPAEVIESVAANLAILKSPTVLRQADGRLWGWEGCCGGAGCCHGSCTHVWNYAQSLPHLFPDLERTLRETEFGPSQDGRGHQSFRSALPIGPTDHGYHAAADGQLGGLMKLHREWRISGDTAWMKQLWPRAKQSLDFCIGQWDPDRTGTLVEPHHNTYDIEFWGADGMCTSFYTGALAAAVAMGTACGDDVSAYATLLAKSRIAMASALWNGAWFVQNVQWQGLRASESAALDSCTPEAVAILQREGPKYQYGGGVLSDGVLGDWMARCCGLGPVLDEEKTAKHLNSVFTHNFRESLADHANPQRPGYAFPREGGLLLCSWPNGDKPSLPFIYSDEVWTGIEYQAASHLIMTGQVEAGLTIVRAIRQRYNGQWRNPFDEYECGHWYARAMASYGLLQAFSGARYDAVTQTLHLAPPRAGDFRAFLCTATGYGTVGVRDGKPFLEVESGTISAQAMDFRAYEP
jgi:uncharacterized protein (DUF608 family)